MYYNVLVNYKDNLVSNLFHLSKADVISLIESDKVDFIHILEVYPHKGRQDCTVLLPSQRSDIGKLLKCKGFKHHYR